MERVDRVKHDFDVLEHVLRGVHASTDDDGELIVQDGVPDMLSGPDLVEVRVVVGRHEEDE